MYVLLLTTCVQAGVEVTPDFTEPFVVMYDVLEALKRGDVRPALE